MGQRARIMVVEDDPSICAGVVACLQVEGYGVGQASTYSQGLRHALAADYDLLLLDLALPGGDGLDILQAMRRRRMLQPVLILTARGAEADRVRGLRLGADDYLLKPFGCDELAARVEALLRRCAPVTPVDAHTQVCFADAEVDFARRCIRWPGGGADLSGQECDLLHLLAQRQQRVVPRAELQACLWPDQPIDLHSRALDMTIRRLREKLGERARALVTVRGVGLRLDTD